MIAEFWRQYSQNMFLYIYYQYERELLARWLRWVSVISYLVTAISLAGWGFIVEYASIWAAVIFLSQVLNELKNLFGISKKVWTLENYLKNISPELNGMTETWRSICLGLLTENEIRNKLNAYTKSFQLIYSEYILPFDFRDRNMLIKKANKKADAMLENLHGKGVVDDAEIATAKAT